MPEEIRALLIRAQVETLIDGVVALDTEAELAERGYMLSSLSRDVQPYRSF